MGEETPRRSSITSLIKEVILRIFNLTSSFEATFGTNLAGLLVFSKSGTGVLTSQITTQNPTRRTRQLF